MTSYIFTQLLGLDPIYKEGNTKSMILTFFDLHIPVGRD